MLPGRLSRHLCRSAPRSVRADLTKKHLLTTQADILHYIIDNNMINGTKLLNVAGMSRGKRDGILKNERGRVVVKVGAMHLKGVW